MKNLVENLVKSNQSIESSKSKKLSINECILQTLKDGKKMTKQVLKIHVAALRYEEQYGPITEEQSLRKDPKFNEIFDNMVKTANNGIDTSWARSDESNHSSFHNNPHYKGTWKLEKNAKDEFFVTKI